LRLACLKAAKAQSLGERGAALVEFGLLAPVLLLILLRMAQFGLTLNQFVTLTNSVSMGALQFALSRSATSRDGMVLLVVVASTPGTAATPASRSALASQRVALKACGVASRNHATELEHDVDLEITSRPESNECRRPLSVLQRRCLLARRLIAPRLIYTSTTNKSREMTVRW
jgi:hypothetical protein